MPFSHTIGACDMVRGSRAGSHGWHSTPYIPIFFNQLLCNLRKPLQTYKFLLLSSRSINLLWGLFLEVLQKVIDWQSGYLTPETGSLHSLLLLKLDLYW